MASPLALAAFEAHLKRAKAPVTIDVLASSADEYRRIATERGWLFVEVPSDLGRVRILCAPAGFEVDVRCGFRASAGEAP